MVITSPYTIAAWNKEKIHPIFPWAMWFNVSEPILLLTCCWKAGTFRLGGSITWQKLVCVCLLAADQLVNFVMCRVEQQLWVYHYTVRCISRADHTGCHVSLIRLSLAGLAAYTERRRSTQQERHSPPTKPALFPHSPADSLLLRLLATQMGLSLMKLKRFSLSRKLGQEKAKNVTAVSA